MQDLLPTASFLNHRHTPLRAAAVVMDEADEAITAFSVGKTQKSIVTTAKMPVGEVHTAKLH